MSNSILLNWLERFVARHFNKRVFPYWCLVLADTVIVCLSTVFVHWAFHRAGGTPVHRMTLWYTMLLYSALAMFSARVFRTYSGVVRYSGFVDLLKVVYANALTFVLAFVAYYLFKYLGITSMTVMEPLQFFAAIVLAAMLMLVMRMVVKTLYDITSSNAQTERVLIYGALTGGAGVAKYIRSENPARFDLRGFITHEKRIKGMQMLGVPVYTVDEDLAEVVRKHGIQGVLVSPLRVDEFRENQAMQDVLIGAGCRIYMSQQAKEASIRNGVLSDEEVENMQLREVSVEDLLPRQEIRVDLRSVEELLQGRRVLITGSAGSIGAEIVRQVAAFKPAKMMLIDQGETPQHDIRMMMKRDFPDVPAETVVTSIERIDSMEHIFASFRPEYVFHAAAYKHVPMMEDNPSEAVMNNVYGTKILADLSVKYGVDKFVMISTDKAVNPTNVMGCSKRICEIYVQSLNEKLKKEAAGGNYTQFVTTRFGNVLGSNGSVIPLFREQIKRGGPVTVTDERIVRFFMLIPEACKLVLEAGTKGNGGEIFVFDMGQPVKIADLAKRMIALSNAKNVQIEYTGLREGEKLYEEVLNEMEGTKPTFHEKIRIAQVREYDYDVVSRDIDELVDISKKFDNMETVRKMKEIVPEYKSNNSVYEVLDH